MLEFEKKILLSAAEYRLLLKTFIKKKENASVQINYYYDTNDFKMNGKGITCKVRSKNDNLEATVKSRCGKGSDCSVEVPVVIDDKLNVESFEIMGLQLQGGLITNRHEIYNDGICNAVLDCNYYLGHVDYELEIEYIKGNEEKSVRLLKEMAKVLLYGKLIVSIESFCRRANASKSKSERFFNFKKA